MRVLIAPDCFGGTLDAPGAAAAIATGWQQCAPMDAVALCPLADGGPGFLDVLHAACGGTIHEAVVKSPIGDPVLARALLVERPGEPSTAYLESADACGLHLVPADRRDPGRTTSCGVGDLIRAALGLGAGRLVVGLGGSGTNDAGAGMLAALGLGAAAGALARGGGSLEAATAEDLAGLVALRRALAGVDLVAAVDVDIPLLGPHGASVGFSPQKGATPAQSLELERALGHFSVLAEAALAEVAFRGELERRGLLAARANAPARRLVNVPGAGAAGGLGFGLALLGARLVPGAAFVAEAVSLAERIAGVELVVTGEGTFDWQSLHGKVVAEVARLAGSCGVPVVVVPGQATVGRREWNAAGISGVYPVAATPAELAESLEHPAVRLAARAALVARTWSR